MISSKGRPLKMKSHRCAQTDSSGSHLKMKREVIISFRKQPLENTRADWLQIVLQQLDRNTKLARDVDTIIARAKRIYVLIIKVNKLFSFFFVVVFSKKNRKHVLRVSIELYKHS